MWKIISLSILVISFSVPGLLFSQVTITGPTCAATGTVYQYNIQGSWDSASTMQVCITGGSIADSSITGNCTPRSAPPGAVRITWSNLSGGTLSVTSSKGNASLQVNVTSALQPGMIDSAGLVQQIDSGGIPQTIFCSPATGGACSPLYRLQWQQSADAVTWSDIDGAVNADLSFSGPPEQPTFYRRKVTETVSGTIDYTKFAMVYITIRSN